MADPPDPSATPLHPDAAAYLDRWRSAGQPAPHRGTPEQARAAHQASAAELAGPGPALAEVRDLHASGVPVRVYRPEGARGTVVYAHGGGWVVGSLDSYDTLCRTLAVHARARVVSVDYPLAPEARHPAPVLAVLAVLRWAAADSPTALAGDSAGAHLACLAAGLAAAEAITPAGLALIYPVVRPGLATRSAAELGSGYYLETATMRWYWQQYLAELDDGPEEAEAVGIPVDCLDQDLTRLPPTLVLTAGFDPLRDEGRALADALSGAGVPVTRLPYPGQLHGFARHTGVNAQAGEALAAVGSFLAGRLADR